MPPTHDRYSDDDDYLILEDELQRIVLRGNINPHEYITGKFFLGTNTTSKAMAFSLSRDTAP